MSGGANEPNPVEDERVHTVWSTYTAEPTALLEVSKQWEGPSPTPDEAGSGVDTPSPNPSATEAPVSYATPLVAPWNIPPSAEGWCCFVATRYGAQYEGKPVSCPGVTLQAGRPDNLYHSADSQILAASPAFYQEWECGKYLLVTNLTNGRQLVVVRMDKCGGCGDLHIDLSEAGMAQLCGVTYPQTCDRLTNLMVQECKEESGIVGSCLK